MSSPHERYAARIAAARSDEVVSSLVDRVDPASDVPLVRWIRRYGRFHPGRQPWAQVVVQAAPLELRRLDLHNHAVPGAVLDAELGPVAVGRPTDDPALPGLGVVLDQLDDAEIIRYRPGKRCTLRGGTAAGSWFVKVAPDGERLCREANDLVGAAERGELGFAVAPMSRWDDATESMWQGVVPGEPVVDDVLGPEGPAMARRLGAALGSLARSGVRPESTASEQDQLDRTGRAVRRVEERIPALSQRVRAVMAQLEERHGALDRAPLVPVHGAPHVNQWLSAGDQLGLVDFDRFALGEPELDIATFVAELASESERQAPVDAYTSAMVEGYCEVGVTIDVPRIELHLLHKLVAKVTRTAWALRVDGPERAARHLAVVEERLATP